MRLAATKLSLFFAKRQPLPTTRARVAAAADPCSKQAKKRRSNRAWRWRAAVASGDAEADDGGGVDDDERGQRATGTRAGRRARLSARRRESVRLPDGVSGDGIGAFLRHPAGVESLLNTGALQSFAPAGSGSEAFTCTLRRIGLLGFEVSPVLDLRIASTSTDCAVEMLSCRGSESVEQQNEHFSAFMRNHVTWGDNGKGPCLDIDVSLEVTLEVYTKPFSLLPLSAVEKPGNLAYWTGFFQCWGSSC